MEVEAHKAQGWGRNDGLFNVGAETSKKLHEPPGLKTPKRHCDAARLVLSRDARPIQSNLARVRVVIGPNRYLKSFP